jgi:hypothetical protein
MSMRELPVSFELKRYFATGLASDWWMSDACHGLQAATVYLFEGEQLDRLEVSNDDLAEMNLPERTCLFECRNQVSDLAQPGSGESFVGHSIVYCWQEPDGALNGLLFQRKSRRAWTRARAHVRLDKDTLDWHYTGTQDTPPGWFWSHEELQNVGMGTSGVLARGCLALSAHSSAAVLTAHMPATKRQHLARKGVGGFVYKIVDVPEPPRPKSEWHGGTHASPRWHKRRGHWRMMASGKRVWVRDCQVGTPDDGMVLKDYAVTPPHPGAHDPVTDRN